MMNMDQFKSTGNIEDIVTEVFHNDKWISNEKYLKLMNKKDELLR